jgi:hypothetical protein
MEIDVLHCAHEKSVNLRAASAGKHPAGFAFDAGSPKAG